MFSFSLASIAALRIGRFSVGSFLLFCLVVSSCCPLPTGSSYSVGFSLTSEHSKGYRKFNSLFSNVPDAVLWKAVTAKSLLTCKSWSNRLSVMASLKSKVISYEDAWVNSRKLWLSFFQGVFTSCQRVFIFSLASFQFLASEFTNSRKRVFIFSLASFHFLASEFTNSRSVELNSR